MAKARRKRTVTVIALPPPSAYDELSLEQQFAAQTSGGATSEVPVAAAPAPNVVTQEQMEAELDRRLEEAQASLASLVRGTKLPGKKERAPSKSLAELKAQHDIDIATGAVEKGQIDDYITALSKVKQDTKEELKRLRRQIELVKEGKSEFVTTCPTGGWQGIGRKVIGLFTREEVDRMARALEIAAALMKSARGGRKTAINDTTDLDITLSEYLRNLLEEADNAELIEREDPVAEKT